MKYLAFLVSLEARDGHVTQFWPIKAEIYRKNKDFRESFFFPDKWRRYDWRYCFSPSFCFNVDIISRAGVDILRP